MNRFFIASHGRFASGIKSSVEILLGTCDNITVFDAYVDESSLREHLDEFYKTVTEDEQVFLLSDLYGGSVNQVMYLYLDKPNTTLIAGINLALVIELVSQDSISPEEAESIVAESRNLLLIVRKDEDQEVDKDFF